MNPEPWNVRNAGTIDLVCSKETLLDSSSMWMGLMISAAELASRFESYPLNWEA